MKNLWNKNLILKICYWVLLIAGTVILCGSINPDLVLKFLVGITATLFSVGQLIRLQDDEEFNDFLYFIDKTGNQILEELKNQENQHDDKKDDNND